MDNTVKYIKEYDNSQVLIFGTKRKKYELLRIKKLLFQLLAFEIITVVYSVGLKKVLFQLARSGDDVLDISINLEQAWLDIPLLSYDATSNDSDIDHNAIDGINNGNSGSRSDSDSECDLMVKL